MARLSKEQWAEARAMWEGGDASVSFQTVADKFGCSRVAVSKTAEREGWTRGGESASQAPKQDEAPKVSPRPKVSTTKTPKVSAKGEEKAPPHPAEEPPAGASGLSQRDLALALGRRPVGRPSEYRPEFVAELISYFDIEVQRVVDVDVVDKDGKTRTEQKLVVNTFPTLTRFAAKIGVTRQTLHDWATEKDQAGALKRPEFSYAYARARDAQESLLVEGGMSGVYEPRFAVFATKNLAGWKDQVETTGEITHTMASTAELDDFYAAGYAQMQENRRKVLERQRRAADAVDVDVRE
jgi:hypothetical protein